LSSISDDKAVVLPVLAPRLDCCYACGCCDSSLSFNNSLLLLLDKDAASLLENKNFLFKIISKN